MATSIGATIAESTGLPVARNVTNLSQSLATESMLAQTDTNTISKPQIANITADTHTPREYVSVAGDTATSLGQKYGVSAQTVRWANGLSSDAIEPGRKLVIPPVDGVLYTVRAGDTIDSIVAKYGANRQDVVAINDLEIVGNPSAGQQLTIPNGNLPESERPGYQAPRTATVSSYSGGYGTSSRLLASAGNGYAYGNCTWYAYERRVQLGLPVGSFWGNANTWAYNASLAGLLVDGNPAAGAIMQNGGGYGHVAIVEAVNPGVSITISEMNGYRFGGGFNRVGHGDLSWSEAVSGMYKYIH
jgi:surface antigen